MQLPLRSAAWRAVVCVLLLPGCLCAGGGTVPGVMGRAGAMMSLRGGSDEAKGEGMKYQKKLQRSYSMNSVMPIADHPTQIVAATSSFDRKGEKRLDLQMETSWVKDLDTIEITVRSKYGGDIIRTGDSDLVMHWGVSNADEEPESGDVEQVTPATSREVWCLLGNPGVHALHLGSSSLPRSN